MTNKENLIAFLGHPYFSNLLVEELQKQEIKSAYFSISNPITKLRKLLNLCPIIHFIGSPTVSKNFLKLIWLKLSGKKIIVSWIGFDIRKSRDMITRKIISKFCQVFIDVNLVEDEKSAKTLSNIGIQSKLLPLPFYRLFPLRDLPSENKIAIYLPDDLLDRWEFYHGDWIKKLVNEFTDIQFIITANTGKNFSEKNVKCFSWIKDMEKLYSQVKAVIRLPKEDATGLTIIETLSMGRIMITSGINFPHCKVVKTYDDLKKHVYELIKNPILNETGSKFVHEQYQNQKFVKDLINLYNLF